MRWAGRIAAVMVMVTVLPCSASATTTDDVDKTLIELLSSMYQIAPPANVAIDRVTMKVMLEGYRNAMEEDCRRRYRNPQTAFRECTVNRPKLEDIGKVVYGWFEFEGASKNNLHIVVWYGSSMDTTVHEWLHWYYYNYRSPAVTWNHENVYRETVGIMASPRFLKWLMARESADD